MHTATLSTGFQISIPKAFREKMDIKAGQQFVLLAKGNSIIMTPRRDIKTLRGMLKGANTENVRDRH